MTLKGKEARSRGKSMRRKGKGNRWRRGFKGIWKIQFRRNKERKGQM